MSYCTIEVVLRSDVVNAILGADKLHPSKDSGDKTLDSFGDAVLVPAADMFLTNLKASGDRVTLVDVLKAVSVKNDKLVDAEIAVLLEAVLPTFSLKLRPVLTRSTSETILQVSDLIKSALNSNMFLKESYDDMPAELNVEAKEFFAVLGDLADSEGLVSLADVCDAYRNIVGECGAEDLFHHVVSQFRG